MKKFLFIIISVIVLASLTACNNDKKVEQTPVDETPVATPTDIVSEPIEDETSNEPYYREQYNSLVDSYESALEEYDLEDYDMDSKIIEKYPLVVSALVAHITRYKEYGVELTHDFYDIDGNGVEELLVGANDSLCAIYSFDEEADKIVMITCQEAMERGFIGFYTNGIILSGGAGGAAVHYYEFGRIAQDGLSYEMLESIEEEYVDEETATYKDAKTGEALEYTSIDEVFEKYGIHD